MLRPILLKMRCLVLVWPLLLGFLYTHGQSCTEDKLKERPNTCCKKCPRGYSKAGPCGNITDMYRCRMCVNGFNYTNMPNTRDKCERCSTCSTGQKTLVACSYKENTVCGGCEEGYYPLDSSSCRACQSAPVPCKKKECWKSFNCNLSTTTTTTMTSPLAMPKSMSNPQVSPLAPASPSVDDLSTLKSTPNPIVSSLTPASPSVDPSMFVPFIPVVSVAVLLLVGFCFVIRFYRSPEKALEFPIEDPQINGNRKIEQQQQQQQSSSHNTQIWDGPSMIFRQSPILPEDPLTRALLPELPAPRQDRQADCWPATVLYAIIKVVPLRRWKEFLRLLSVEDRQLERVELEVSHSLGSLEKQYQMLTLWSHIPSAALDDVYSALHYMDLAGCAQQLQESLENLHWETNSRLKLVNVRQNTGAAVNQV